MVIRVVGGGVFLRRCLDSLVPQIEGRNAEVVVPFDSTVGGIDDLRAAFPSVRFVDLGVVPTRARPVTGGAAHELYDRRTAAGIHSSRGEIVAILEDYGVPAVGWYDRLLEAHRRPVEAIGGAVEHVGSGALNWAVYLLDFGRYQPPFAEGPARYLTDVNISYKRSALEAVKTVWSERYNEVTVNWALLRMGGVLWRSDEVKVKQDRGALTLRGVVAERIAWGRLFGSVRSRESNTLSRVLLVACSPAIPIVLITRIARRAIGTREELSRFVVSLPHLVLVTTFWCIGEAAGYVAGDGD